MTANYHASFESSNNLASESFWEGCVAGSGRENVRRGFEESSEFAGLIATLAANGSVSSNPISEITSRVDPRNQPGGGLLTRDATWSVPLLSLPGRAGLDLGLALSYSSQVWTTSGPFIYFDEDNGFPSPGFRLGFPIVQRKSFDAQTATNTFLLITGSGQRVELRQVGTSNIYEAADSSYLQLTDNGSSWLVRASDGTQMTYAEHNNEYHCVQVKDRNGNFLTVNYNGLGRITTITDTLTRVITFNYDSNQNLQSITQSWNGQTHQWVTFGWTTRTMQTSFTDSVVRLIGTANGASLPVINQVAVNDGSYFQFDYTNSLQVSAVRRYHVADNPAILRSQIAFVYETTTGDAPRITDSNVSAFNWTGIEGVPSQVTTHYEVAGDGACVLTAPDGTIYKEYYGTDWRKGLTTLSEVWSGGVKQKWTTTVWTQDNTTAGIKYETNPRVTETNVYDKDNNRRRTTTSYATFSKTGSGATVALPSDVYEYAADAVTFNRYLHTDYEHQQTSGYLNYHILSVPWRQFVYDGSYNLMSQVAYSYDAGGEYLVNTSATPPQHDSSYSTSSPAFRGNLTEVKQHDVTDPSNESKTRKQKLGYDINGSVVFTRDALNHQASVSYADSFSDAVNRNTFAYPTTTTDPDSNSSYLQYNFDFGATTRAQGPPPAGQSQGAIQTMSYYSSTGQLERVTTTNSGAYKRFWYGPNYIASFATVNNVADEAYSIAMFDGVGRVIGVASNHPGSAGGYKAQVTSHDLMGRPVKTSNPTEINGNWTPSGDDAAGWLNTQQTYNWQGKPLITTNPDGTTKEASYSGCGCAGGEVVTLTDEGTLDGGVAKRRQQKIYSDVLGRTVKTEILNWQGGSVYSATVNTYNVRDQVTQVRQYVGPESSGSYQESAMTYDGYGRLKTRRLPQQDDPNNPYDTSKTTWTYNADNTVNTITDGRGAVATYGFTGTNRGLVKSIVHALSGSPTISVTYSYDAVGNRTSMAHTVGGVAHDDTSYSYDQLSRLTAETIHINQLQNYGPNYGYYTIGYDYTVSGQLKQVIDPFNSPTDLTYDETGRTKTVTGTWNGTNHTYVSSVSYRAWGAVKSLNGGTATSFNSRMLPTHYGDYDYSYYDDGKLKEFRDQDDQVGNPQFVQFHYMSRAYSYDQVGRVSSVGQVPNGVIPPFSGNYGYDAFDNLTSRGGQYALNSYQSDTASYANNRRAGWTYNAEGQVTNSSDNSDSGGSSTRAWTYDARGTQILTSEVRNGQTLTTALGYDGDGQLIGQILDGTVAEYLIRSSVLGKVLTKVTQTGGKWMTYVPTNGLLTPIQNQNPGSTPFMSVVTRDPLGIQENGSAYDPFGNLVANVQPPVGGGPPGYTPVYGPPYGWGSSLSTNANNFATGCNAGGVSADCRQVILGAMGLDFANTLGLHLDNFTGELNYDHAVTVNFVRRAFDLDVPSSYFGKKSAKLPNLPVDPQNPTGGGRFGSRPCATMADFAQAVADSVGDAPNPLMEFDTAFAAEYLGRFDDGVGRPMRTLRDVLHYSKGGGTRNRGATGMKLGQRDFLPGFYETSSSGAMEDQTHHFAAYFSLGINNRRASQTLAKGLDSSGGKADQDLASAAFSIGRTLRQNPSALSNIGDIIRKNICITE